MFAQQSQDGRVELRLNALSYLSIIDKEQAIQLRDSLMQLFPPVEKKLSATLRIRADVLADTDWQYTSYAKPDRGLHDHERFITFSAPLSKDEEERVEKFLKSYDNPGYCSWSFRHLGNNKYRLTSTLDSSG